jgi:hypothetical protein
VLQELGSFYWSDRLNTKTGQVDIELIKDIKESFTALIRPMEYWRKNDMEVMKDTPD